MALKKITQTVQYSSEEEMYTEYTQFVYIGPSLPNGRLKENAVLQGSYSTVLHYLSEIVEEYPQIKRLIVPIHKLGEYAAKVKTSGNIVNKYYSDVISGISSKREE